jgi:hypothetical protein
MSSVFDHSPSLTEKPLIQMKQSAKIKHALLLIVDQKQN